MNNDSSADQTSVDDSGEDEYAADSDGRKSQSGCVFRRASGRRAGVDSIAGQLTTVLRTSRRNGLSYIEDKEAAEEAGKALREA